MPQLPFSCLGAGLTKLLGPMSVLDSILTVLLSMALQPSPSLSSPFAALPQLPFSASATERPTALQSL